MSDLDDAETMSSLSELTLDALREIWQTRWGAPPALRAPELLRLMIAWRIQAEREGGLDAASRRVLAQTGRALAEGLDLGPGSVLRREWDGVLHEVEVTDRGFRWQGAVYKSLSAVATAIAGTRWNGPRFFGLRAHGSQAR